MTNSNFFIVLISGLLLFPGQLSFAADSPPPAGPCYETGVEAYSYAGMIRGDLQIRWYVMTATSETGPPPKVRIMMDGEVVPKPTPRGLLPIPNRREYPAGSVFFGERWLNVQSADSTVEILVENQKKPECNTKMRVDIPPLPKLTSADISILSELGESDLLKSAKVKVRDKIKLRQKLDHFLTHGGVLAFYSAVRDDIWYTKTELFREYVAGLMSYDHGNFPIGPIRDWRLSSKGSFTIRKAERNSEILSEQDLQGVECLVSANLVRGVAKYGPSTTLDRVSQVGEKLCSDKPVSKNLINVSLSIAGGLMARDYYGWYVPTQQNETQTSMSGTDDPSTTVSH